MSRVEQAADLIRSLSPDEQKQLYKKFRPRNSKSNKTGSCDLTVNMVTNSFKQMNSYNWSVNSKPHKIGKYGERIWTDSEGRPHRTTKDSNDQTLPAIVFPDGKQVWYCNGNIHRVDLINGKLQPALISVKGDKLYRIHGYKINYSGHSDIFIFKDDPYYEFKKYSSASEWF